MSFSPIITSKRVAIKFSIVLLFFSLPVFCQTDSVEVVSVKEFGWTIKFPRAYTKVKKEDWKKHQDKGLKAFEKTFDTDIENHTNVIFVYQNGYLNYFEVNSQDFNPKTDGNFKESFDFVNQALLTTFKSQMPNCTFSQKSEKELISGLEFLKCTTTVTYPNGMILETYMYSRLFGTKELTINIMGVSKSARENFLTLWRKSEFKPVFKPAKKKR